MAKRRPPGDGMIRLKKKGQWESSYSPKLPNGKRRKFNIHADTREECEEKIAVMIKQKNAEIAAEKKKVKQALRKGRPRTVAPQNLRYKFFFKLCVKSKIRYKKAKMMNGV